MDTYLDYRKNSQNTVSTKKNNPIYKKGKRCESLDLTLLYTFCFEIIMHSYMVVRNSKERFHDPYFPKVNNLQNYSNNTSNRIYHHWYSHNTEIFLWGDRVAVSIWLGFRSGHCLSFLSLSPEWGPVLVAQSLLGIVLSPSLSPTPQLTQSLSLSRQKL